MMESFWSRMQVKLLDRHRWRTRIELANAIFECLEIWHNRQRRPSSIGMLTPKEFENTPPWHEIQKIRLHRSRGRPSSLAIGQNATTLPPPSPERYAPPDPSGDWMLVR